MSDRRNGKGRTSRDHDGVQRLEKILSKHVREPQRSECIAEPRQSTEQSVAEQPSTVGAIVDGVSMDSDRGDAAQRQNGVMVEELECSEMESALKEQVYRLADRWEQGAQRLTDHLQDALRDLADVRQQENDLLKRRVELCHQELDDQVAQLERSFQLKVEQCKQQMLARIADQRADCEMAIKVKAESLLAVLEQVDAVPSPSSPGMHLHAANQRVSSSCPDHRLAHAACPCYEQDDESQYTDVKAGHGQTADSWSAVPPMRRRLNYLVPSPNADRSIPLSVQKYMHKSSDRQEWWKPARLALPERQSPLKHVPQSKQHADFGSPAHERLAGLGVGFRKYRPCECRTRSGMLAPRPPLRLSHLLEQSDDDL